MVAQTMTGREEATANEIVLPPAQFDRQSDRIGAKDDFAHVPVGLLHIDHVYQRGLNANRVAAIVRDFDEDVFQVVTVSKRKDGSFWVLDGQHRVEAVRLLFAGEPSKKLPCLILRDLDEGAEARIFYKLNRHRLQPTAADAFKARLAFGEEVATAIKATCDRHGVVLGFWGSNLSANECVAIAALEAIYRAGRLAYVLDLIGRSWPGEAGAYKSKYLLGINRFLMDWGDQFYAMPDGHLAEQRMKRLVDLVAAMGPVGLEKAAAFYIETIKARTSVAMSRAIYHGFQKNLRGKLRLPEWGDEESPEVTSS